MLGSRLKAPDLTVCGSSPALQILDSSIKLRYLRLGWHLGLRRANVNRSKGLTYLAPRRPALERHIAHFLENRVAFLQAHFLYLPARIQPSFCMRVRGRVTPPCFIPVRAHRKIAADETVYASERKPNKFRKSSPELQVSREPTIFRNRPWGNNPSRAVEAQHTRRITSGNIRHHAVQTEQTFASLALSQISDPKHPAADTAFIPKRHGKNALLQSKCKTFGINLHACTTNQTRLFGFRKAATGWSIPRKS